MSQHKSEISWSYKEHELEKETYSRNHVVSLNGGQNVNVSASVEFKGDERCADPEQMLISALASCHMLFFLAIAEIQGYRVESYKDSPVGFLEKSDGGMAVTRIELSPRVIFGGDKSIDEKSLTRLHNSAHRSCFIRNSIKADVSIKVVL
ncbi:OsmC family protein [Marinobacterium rhizophilum]|uniref:OsmC family protein n=1 Tax=Marinobacterium rhizophilum TaxID=420402 RepID=A0ABY5HI25_9GAMM|nr:OsmC family protein [Marinobacterium rhizophilum]UTW12013.1 OsmC family protein [Marinobacterium rhizophilum]